MELENLYLNLYLLLIFCSSLTAAFALNNSTPPLETPKVTKDQCTKCDYKVDSGDTYICCIDCSDPHTSSDDPKLCYCVTGAELLVEPRPKEVYKWIAGPWEPCSLSCDGGIRYRNVECYAVFEDTLLLDYPVYDDKCSMEVMPAREEPCNLNSCLQLNDRGSQGRKPNRRPTWMFGLLIFLGLLAIGCYIEYRRRTSMQYGHVYIMMADYS